jgi:hypothetical protein
MTTRPALIPVPPDEQPGLDREWKVAPVTIDLRRPQRSAFRDSSERTRALMMWRWQGLVGR